MKYVLIDLETQQAHVFSCRTNLSTFIGKHTKTVERWQKQGNIKRFKTFLICFDTTVHKATQQARSGF